MNITPNAKIIAVCNAKGGVGKTMSVASLAAVLVGLGYNVLGVDMDLQHNLSLNFLSKEPENTILDYFNGEKLPVVNIRQGFDLVPGSAEMANIDSMIEGPEDRFYLSKGLAKVKSKYDFIIIDCPPSTQGATINAFTAADYLFVPTLATMESLLNIARVSEAVCRAGTPTRINGIFFTMFDPRKKLTRKIEALARAKYGDAVMQSCIKTCVKLPESVVERKDIMAYAPNSQAASDYQALAEEMLMIINKEEQS